MDLRAGAGNTDRTGSGRLSPAAAIDGDRCTTVHASVGGFFFTARGRGGGASAAGTSVAGGFVPVGGTGGRAAGGAAAGRGVAAGGTAPSGRDPPAPSGRLVGPAAPPPPAMGGRGEAGRNGAPPPSGRLAGRGAPDPPPIMREPGESGVPGEDPGEAGEEPALPASGAPGPSGPAPGARRGLRLKRLAPPADAPPNPGRSVPGRDPNPVGLLLPGRDRPGRAPPWPGRWNARGPRGEVRGAFSTGCVRLPFFTASLICTSRPLIRLPVSVSIASCPSCGSRNSTIAKPRGCPSASSARMISSTASPKGSKYGFSVSSVVRGSRFPTYTLNMGTGVVPAWMNKRRRANASMRTAAMPHPGSRCTNHIKGRTLDTDRETELRGAHQRLPTAPTLEHKTEAETSSHVAECGLTRSQRLVSPNQAVQTALNESPWISTCGRISHRNLGQREPIDSSSPTPSQRDSDATEPTSGSEDFTPPIAEDLAPRLSGSQDLRTEEQG